MNKSVFSTARFAVSVIALTSAHLANAQQQPAPSVAAAQSAPNAGNGTPSSVNSTSGAASSGALEEVVVTAERRNENQQSVPISISVVTAQDLTVSGVQGTEALGTVIPSLQFSRQTTNGGAPFLRGVGSTNAVIGTESPVAVYVDDVYMGAATSTIMQFNNISGVEVLKGPQGTLFGRNATGGVVSVHTLEPSHTASMDAVFGGGSYGTYYGNVYATTGLSDTVAANIAVTGTNQTQGYGRAIATGDDIYWGWDWGVHSQLLWEPSSATRALFSFDYSKDRGDAGANVVVAPGSVGLGGGTNVGRFESYSNPPDFAENRIWGFSANVSQDFEPFKLVSISAYRQAYQDIRFDADAGPPGVPPIIAINGEGAGTTTISQEFRLVSPGSGKFNWVAGFFYYHANADQPDSVGTGLAYADFGGRLDSTADQKLNSYSGFGEASYEVLPSTKITLGVRETEDQYSLSAFRLNAAGEVLAPGLYQANTSFNKFTYRGIVDQQLSENVMVYASYSEGFHSGGYPVNSAFITVNGVPSFAPPVAPETLGASEIGIKSEFFDHTLRFNAAAFYYDYSNLQVNIIQNSTVLTLNAAKAHIKGTDGDLTYVPFKGLEITAGASYLDAKFVEFPNGPLYVPNPANCTTLTTTGARSGGNTACIANLAGNQLPRAPEFSGNIGATYTMPSAVGDFAGSVTLYHSARFPWEVDNRYFNPTENLLGASLSWKAPDGRWGVRIYGKNLLNNYYYDYFSETSGRDAGYPAMPRNFGGEVSLHF